jgi:RNA polymerase sigma-70 factor (ECF subfamily)
MAGHMATHASAREENDLISQLKQGDSHAFTVLFNGYGRKLYRFAYGFLKSREEAEEVVQDAFVRLWENREKLDANGSLGGYLFRIAYRLVLNRIRQATREKQLAVHFPPQASPLQNTTEEEMASREMGQLVERAVATLPPKRKEIFQLSRHAQLSHQEIADQMNISKKTVEAQLTQALRHVRRYLGVHGDWLLVLLSWLHL